MEFLCLLSAIFALFIHQALGSCEKPVELLHGYERKFAENKWIFECDYGYTIQGRSEVTCINDLLRGERPFCTKSGCEELEPPKDGQLINPAGLSTELKCHKDYDLVGNKFTYCDGKNWLNNLGTCRATRNYACDFESEDLCGWTFPHRKPQPWSRVSTLANFHSTRTGSQRDHTFQKDDEGHFIRMETQTGATGSYHFESPVFPQHLSSGNSTTTCFQFHFFMFGPGVGSLFVSVKPASMPVEEMWGSFRSNSTLFQKCGDLGSNWYEHSIPIAEMDEDFQVIFTVTDAQSRFGDIAIDDVRFLMTEEECKEAFVVKDYCPPKLTVHSGAVNTNRLHIYNLALVSLAAIIMWP